MKKYAVLMALVLCSGTVFAKQVEVGCKAKGIQPDGDQVILRIDTLNHASINLVKDEEGHSDLALRRTEGKDGEYSTQTGVDDFYAFAGKGASLLVTQKMYRPGAVGSGGIILNGAEYECVEGSWGSY